MKKVAVSLLVLGVTVALGGCGTTRTASKPVTAGYTATPQLRAGGTAEQQQHQAQLFDPYPDNNIAPAIAGGRPPGYEQPLPETERSRWTPRRAGFEPVVGAQAAPCPQLPYGPTIQPPNGPAAVPPVGSP
jgi:hypothetical protein